MASLLYINASPRGEQSSCGRIAGAFLDEYRARNPSDTIAAVDLFRYDLPEFGPVEAEAKFAPIYGRALTPEQERAWARVEREIEIFRSAGRIVLAAPMWNLGIPYKLKHYLDLYRMEYALQYKIAGEQTKSEALFKDILLKNVSWKSKMLYRLPRFVLVQLLNLKRFLRNMGIDFSVYN